MHTSLFFRGGSFRLPSTAFLRPLTPSPHRVFVPNNAMAWCSSSELDEKPIVSQDQEIHTPAPSLDAKGKEDFSWLDSILDEDRDPWVRGSPSHIQIIDVCVSFLAIIIYLSVVMFSFFSHSSQRRKVSLCLRERDLLLSNLSITLNSITV